MAESSETQSNKPKPLNADIAYPNETETIALKHVHVHRRITGKPAEGNKPADRFMVTPAQAKRLKAAKIAE